MNALAQAIAGRRSVYALNRELPLPPGDIVATIEHALRHAPSAFNSQSTRLLVLFGAEHEKLWDIAADVLQDAAPPEIFAQQTAPKLAAFRAAAGSILFYQDTDVVSDLQQRMPLYADTFPVSADKEFAMMQYAIWTTFAAARIGANIQHYNPLIDEAVAQTWQVPAHWRLRSQMVFGGIAAPAVEREYAPHRTTPADFRAGWRQLTKLPFQAACTSAASCRNP